jgi:phthalate 4,5-dioxygenase
MLSVEENALLTRTGAATPGGGLLRRYWQPVALAEELPLGGAPLPVRILGEDLVLFRDDAGRPGLLALHCPHRGADLSYGRLEDGGLRCLYHGWLFDVGGRCLEQPGEPASSTFKDRVRQTAYSCQEAAGVIFAYLGPGEPPCLPAYSALLAPATHRFVVKIYQECNYLQGNEGNIDPVHTSFLHRTADTSLDPRAVSGSSDSPRALFGRDASPTVEIEETDYGLRIVTLRRVGAETHYLRISNFLFPNASAIAGQTAGFGYSIHWHVPIDDTHHWRYELVVSDATPLDHDQCWARYGPDLTPERRLIRNPANRYRQDRAEMERATYAGLGTCFQVHDAYATESQGAIQDRPREHLGATDRAIIKARQQLLRGVQDVQAGREPMHVVRDAAANNFAHLVVVSEVVPVAADWRTYWQPPAVAGPTGRR